MILIILFKDIPSHLPVDEAITAHSLTFSGDGSISGRQTLYFQRRDSWLMVIVLFVLFKMDVHTRSKYMVEN
jgi:hypothetical protein